jgi:hypothetical protein
LNQGAPVIAGVSTRAALSRGATEDDRLFGAGTGEAFFMGPYLDVLPATVNRLIDRGSE